MHIYWHCVLCVQHMATGAASYLYTGAVFSVCIYLLALVCSALYLLVLCVQHMSTGAVCMS